MKRVFVAGADLADVCVKLIDNLEKELNVGGPEIFTYKEIAEMAFDVLNKKPKLSYLPLWMIKIILLLMRTFTSSKTYGPFEFMATVMTTDVVGESYGNEKLENFFKRSSTT